jgi:hypothetical protein
MVKNENQEEKIRESWKYFNSLEFQYKFLGDTKVSLKSPCRPTQKPKLPSVADGEQTFENRTVASWPQKKSIKMLTVPYFSHELYINNTQIPRETAL